jgi:hypothetical protein
MAVAAMYSWADRSALLFSALLFGGIDQPPNATADYKKRNSLGETVN